ncbi:gamma-glutamyl-gamma-aminobutyrate hydrolase family protein [Microvirga mediterraneensis]|uniref:Gamma-glutamyl-gamma-aminobutyrate hydrolase family protein n=1 Tax=Microvirga mediterraneensis TaxID=2754695 RepID=A0A838BLT3_9HYPH|nr:gamma-glutamyl-gamma-aminobutyrate hydrolase family protein [Microvirga mediterraneensis]MBA1156634.1 gamma-glutamyl-gamma-aminobutyrate hydrolase family protein [Microvirga mediterraneensis]
MSAKPRIAVIMDENSSAGGNAYDVSKAYFEAVHRAGGMPFGIPYLADMVETVVAEFDGFISVGGRIRFPGEWYPPGEGSRYPSSERLGVEQALMRGFLERDKPVLGICNGMQMLAGLHGGRMVHEIRKTGPHILDHDSRGAMHTVEVMPGTMLSRIVGTSRLDVNSRHQEAVVEVSDQAVISARADDGVIEAIEIPSRRFAVGVQWHPELLAAQDHPSRLLFDAFVKAVR